MTDKKVPGIRPYDAPAGGWGALKATARAVFDEMGVIKAADALLHANKPGGFDCPGCAWPDRNPSSTFQFCENGAKAVTWEATRYRVTPDFFAQNSVSDLLTWSDYELEGKGRLTHPMVYDRETDRYQPIAWDDAFARIGARLRSLPNPDMADFYTSGRASNEAAFLFNIFAREYGSNNFPDCSNMCHEATSVGLPHAIGIGKGTVTLDDFHETDLIISMGHNPGTNHPRMMGDLWHCARRGVPILAFNPLKELSLERFADPQDALQMATFGSTQISSTYFMLKVGGDAAALKGIIKAVLEAEDRSGDVLDRAFIAEHTLGFEAFAANIRATDWGDIERLSGLSRGRIEDAARAYIAAKSTIVTYGMGITQHARGTQNVQLIAALLLLKGNYGRPGAGICPLRGHSNVQGNRTVGITEKPDKVMFDRVEKTFGFRPPDWHGHDAVATLEAMARGYTRALVCLGGNFAVAMPDPDLCARAMRGLDLAVHLNTKLNRSNLLVAKETFILPVLGRTERDIQAGGPQVVTVEDSMSMVHASHGGLKPASEYLRSEPAIIAGIAKATLPGSKVDWDWLIADYDRIRDKIEEVYHDFVDYNRRIRIPGGFRLPIGPMQRVWHTPSGKAEFIVIEGVEEDAPPAGDDVLTLATLRSHDQYNTTIYGLDDRYRGVFGRRDILFMNENDMKRRGLNEGDRVSIQSALPGQDARVLRLTAVSHAISEGSVGAYYPEANILCPLDHKDAMSGTPSYKSLPVRISKAA